MTRTHDSRVPRIGMLAVVLAACVVAAGCAPFQAPVKAPQGLLYTRTKAPLTTKFAATPAGEAVTRHASETTLYIYEPFITGIRLGWGDVAIEPIARRAGIREVAFADYETELFLSVFGRFTIHVYGN